MLTKSDLNAIALLINRSLEEQLEIKLEEKLETKLEEKLEVKLEGKLEKLEMKLEDKINSKLDQRLSPIENKLKLINQKLNRLSKDVSWISKHFDNEISESRIKIDKIQTRLGMS